MKTKNYILLIAALTFSFALPFCTPEEEESCNSEDIGQEVCTNEFSAVATLCTDGVNNSYYTYNGNKYECEGVEPATCDSALYDLTAQMIVDGCETSKSGNLNAVKIILSPMAENLLLEVRKKSLCN